MDGLFEAVAGLVLGFAVIGLVMTALGRFAPLCELKKRVSLHQGSHWT